MIEFIVAAVVLLGLGTLAQKRRPADKRITLRKKPGSARY
jgi:hypothetical protein